MGRRLGAPERDPEEGGIAVNYCVLLDCLSNRAKPIQQVKKTGILQTATT